MAGVSTMFAPSYSSAGPQESLRLWNLAGMWNYLSGEKSKTDACLPDSSSKPLADLTTPTTTKSAYTSPNSTTSHALRSLDHASSNLTKTSPTVGDDGELLNGASVSCNVCHKKFANVHRLQRHMISHNESDVLRRFKCDECGKAFKFKHHLKEHKRIHSGEKPFECEHCGKRFSHSGSYSSHMSSKKCQLGRARSNITFGNRTSPHYSSPIAKRSTVPVSSAFMPILPKGDSPTPSDLGYSSPPGTISQDSLLMSPPSLISPGGLSGASLGSSIRPTFSPSSLSQNLHPGLSPYHPFNSLILAAQLQPQYTLLSLLSKKERENEVEDLKNGSSQDASDDEDREPGELVIKEEGREEDADERGEEEKEENRSSFPPEFPNASHNYTESLKQVLEKVNSSVTKMKFEEAVSQASNASMLRRMVDEPRCALCGIWFSNRIEALQHSRFYCPRLADISSVQESYKGQLIEGLAARLYKEAGPLHSPNDLLLPHSKPLSYLPELSMQSAQSLSQSQMFQSQQRDNQPSLDYDFSHSIVDQEETTSDGKKVRVRSHIREDQLAILRAHYSLNPRPKKDELQIIAEKVDFPVRVVQVWFQNARARDRREGRCLTPSTLSYLPNPISFLQNSPISYTNSGVTNNNSPITTTSKSVMNSLFSHVSSVVKNGNLNTQGLNNELPVSADSNLGSDSAEFGNEEEMKPLDLSTRKSFSFPSPKTYDCSDSDNESNSLAISYKSESRSPSPTTFNNNVDSKELNHYVPTSSTDQQSSKLAQILESQRTGSFASPSSERDYGEKRPREDDGSGDESRKRRREEDATGIFPCDQCDKAFSKQSSLARHKYEHSGMRPYKCELCPKAFKHKHHLIEHSRLHTGEKPYQCYKCLKRFSHSGSYSQHMNHRFSYCKPFSGASCALLSSSSSEGFQPTPGNSSEGLSSGSQCTTPSPSPKELGGSSSDSGSPGLLMRNDVPSSTGPAEGDEEALISASDGKTRSEPFCESPSESKQESGESSKEGTS